MSRREIFTEQHLLTLVSRTATAPFDRLKVFLITRSPELSGVKLTSATDPSKTASQGFRAIFNAIGRIYTEGGVRGFWVGNGLSVAKIFPESAIKFFSYETAVCFSYLESSCVYSTKS